MHILITPDYLRKPEIDFFDEKVIADENHIVIEFNDIFELRHIVQTNLELNGHVIRKIKKDGSVDERLFLECLNDDYAISYKEVKHRINYMWSKKWNTIIKVNEDDSLSLMH